MRRESTKNIIALSLSLRKLIGWMATCDVQLTQDGSLLEGKWVWYPSIRSFPCSRSRRPLKRHSDGIASSHNGCANPSRAGPSTATTRPAAKLFDVMT
jgi:hypothetical protein